jgi:hypothetical protein
MIASFRLWITNALHCAAWYLVHNLYLLFGDTGLMGVYRLLLHLEVIEERTNERLFILAPRVPNP